ncbi:hypothetical protein [Membranihabitans marinus]|uniref:hypothetical protein n=1 Tax=Membranihabitans marinus TaxID=1227546 RepID=UPI001F294DA3|nr:hypothetical protein [Membranihabitans marinus]
MKTSRHTYNIYNKPWGLIILTLLAFHLTSCKSEPELDRDTLISNEINKRLNQFILARKTECYNNTMNMAIRQTDSLVKLNAVKYIEDDLHRPALPVKPPKELRPTPKDTIKNRPFLKDSTKSIQATDTIN